MRLSSSHSWRLAYSDARTLQEQLAERVKLEDEPEEPHVVTGLDVAFDRGAGLAVAAAVSMTLPDLEILEVADGEAPLEFPYIPGLLSFREGPAVLDALARLRRSPDLILCDGQGIAHPRRFGLASHIGVLAEVASIGVAKSRYVGEHAPPSPVRGAVTPLLLDGDEVGRVVTTRAGVRPLYVSPGHRVSLDRAVDLVLQCCTRYRLPEPCRQAHRRVTLRRSGRLGPREPA